MDSFATPGEKQKRSMSYNELKKKRLMHSQSQRKVGQQGQGTGRKGMSEVKSILSAIPKDEQVIQSCISELKGVLGSLRERSAKKRVISIRDSLTERPSLKQSIDISKPMWEHVEGGETKQLIKHLLNKNRSQRRLVKFNDIRDKFKKEKERSLSQDRTAPTPKPIPSPLKDKTLPRTAEHEPIATRLAQPLEQQLDLLCRAETAGRLWGEEVLKESQQAGALPFEASDISSISSRAGQGFNESELRVLEGEGGGCEGSFLALLRGERRPRGKEVRRRGELERMRRIFPSDFFGN